MFLCGWQTGSGEEVHQSRSWLPERMADGGGRQFGSMSEKVLEYEKLLKELIPKVGEQDARLISTMLEKVNSPAVFVDDETDLMQETFGEGDSFCPDKEAKVPIDTEVGSEDSGAESEVSGARGSTGALDVVEEDFTANERARATGYIGKNSEISWIQRLQCARRAQSSSSSDGDSASRRRSGGRWCSEVAHVRSTLTVLTFLLFRRSFCFRIELPS